jgi:hypothetical protein
MNRVLRARLIVAIVLLIIIAGVLGYGIFASAPYKIPPGNYYPLAVGNQWTYKMIPDGKTYNEDVTQKTAVGDHDAYAVAIDDDYSYMGKLKGSVYQFGQGEPSSPKNMAVFDPPQLVYPLPFSIGSTWETPVPSEAMVQDSENVYVNGSVEDKADITVPAGTFVDCIHVVVDDPRDSPSEETELWFAANIGIVKTITYTVIGNRPPTATTTELVKSKILPNSE